MHERNCSVARGAVTGLRTRNKSPCRKFADKFAAKLAGFYCGDFDGDFFDAQNFTLSQPRAVARKRWCFFMIPNDPDALLTRKNGAAALTEAGYPVAEDTLASKATRGGGPPYRKFGKRVLYRWGDLLAWAQSRLGPVLHSTSEADAAPCSALSMIGSADCAKNEPPNLPPRRGRRRGPADEPAPAPVGG
jgi:hypothetical protein